MYRGWKRTVVEAEPVSSPTVPRSRPVTAPRTFAVPEMVTFPSVGALPTITPPSWFTAHTAPLSSTPRLRIWAEATPQFWMVP